MYKAKELRNQSDEELSLRINTLRKDIFELRSEQLTERTQKTHLIREKRKEIACIMTIKREKELKRV